MIGRYLRWRARDLRRGFSGENYRDAQRRAQRRKAEGRALTPGAVAFIIAVLLVLFIAGLIINSRTASRAHAAGCISLNDMPADYIPRNNDPCPDGYTSRIGCVVATSDDPAQGTGGCDFGTKPGTG